MCLNYSITTVLTIPRQEHLITQALKSGEMNLMGLKVMFGL